MQKNTGISRIIKAFGYSYDGFRAAFRDETAFRQEIFLCAILIPLACFIAPDRVALALMIGSLLLMLIVELINSGIEAVVDRQGTELHPLAKKAKDVGSAAVLVACINAFLVWVFMLA